MNIPAVLDNIIDLFKHKGDSVLGVDIGSSSIKIVQIKNKAGRAVLETYGEIALGPYANLDIGRSVKLRADQTVNAIKDVLKESNVTTNVCGMAIPLSASIITTMQVPQVGNSNIDEIVSMEARRYIPVAMEEITLDWQVLPDRVSEIPQLNNTNTENGIITNNLPPLGVRPPVENPNKTKTATVLIVAVHTEVINNMKQVSAGANLNCDFLELEAFSTIRSSTNNSVSTFAVADFGASATKVYISEGGVIRNFHIVPFGSQDLTLAISRSLGVPIAEAEKIKRSEEIKNNSKLSKLFDGSVSFITNEISKFLRDYEIKNNVAMGELIITGGGSSVAGFKEFIKNRIPVSVRSAEPFANVLTPAFLENVLKSIGPSFSVAVGAALRALEDEKHSHLIGNKNRL
jgi:type IV pilus assembly protein PilM